MFAITIPINVIVKKNSILSSLFRCCIWKKGGANNKPQFPPFLVEKQPQDWFSFYGIAHETIPLFYFSFFYFLNFDIIALVNITILWDRYSFLSVLSSPHKTYHKFVFFCHILHRIYRFINVSILELFACFVFKVSISAILTKFLFFI